MLIEGNRVVKISKDLVISLVTEAEAEVEEIVEEVQGKEEKSETDISKTIRPNLKRGTQGIAHEGVPEGVLDNLGVDPEDAEGMEKREDAGGTWKKKRGNVMIVIERKPKSTIGKVKKVQHQLNMRKEGAIDRRGREVAGGTWKKKRGNAMIVTERKPKSTIGKVKKVQHQLNMRKEGAIDRRGRKVAGGTWKKKRSNAMILAKRESRSIMGRMKKTQNQMKRRKETRILLMKLLLNMPRKKIVMKKLLKI